MIVYSGTVSSFNEVVDSGQIADLLIEELKRIGAFVNNEAEIRSWNNSLLHMKTVIDVPEINKDLCVALEYQIPITSKRVDFIITGIDDMGKSNVVIVELKQWEKAERTSRGDIVTTLLAGGIRAVTHPSYQAYSYAKTIENYNEYVQEGNIKLYPCSFLHNYNERYRDELDNELYHNIIELSPIFLQRDKQKLREFIARHVKKSDNGELLYQIDHGKIRPSKALQDAISSMLNGNEEFLMIDEQKVVFETVSKLVENATKRNKKYTIIVEGGPGTGKSVIAINLLARFKHQLVNYVTKNAAPREVFAAMLYKNDFTKSYVKTLFKSSGSYINVEPNKFDLLIVDEAHRLNEKSGMYGVDGENQIKEIINSSLVSVFFIDEDQIVTTKDFGSIEEIKKQAKLLGSTVLSGEEYKLTSQFRCNGSDGYIAFMDDVLGIRKTANYDGFDLDYDIKVFDDPVAMRDALREKNKINNKARMIAGYCYNWVSRNKDSVEDYDIHLENGFKARWNFANTKTWAIDKDSFEQVGCIHTAQGLEFDYIGVIIGNDLRFENGRVITDFKKRAKTDYSLNGTKTTKNYDLADRIIRNTYKTHLTRGQKGCYIYCEDKALSEYLKARLAFNLN